MIYTIYHFFPLICTIDSICTIVKKDEGLGLFIFAYWNTWVWSGCDLGMAKLGFLQRDQLLGLRWPLSASRLWRAQDKRARVVVRQVADPDQPGTLAGQYFFRNSAWEGM